MGNGKLHRTQRLGNLANGVRTGDEAGATARALAVSGQVEQYRAKSATTKLLGECGHKGCLAGPTMDKEDAADWRAVRLQHVGLEVASACRDPQRHGLPQVEPRPLHEDVVVRAAMPRKVGRAESTIGIVPPQLGRIGARRTG